MPDDFIEALAAGVVITALNAYPASTVTAVPSYDAEHNQLPELIADIPFCRGKFLIIVERLPDTPQEGDPDGPH
jgi:hypothetical protein